jgi:hypothetical protein
MTTRRKPVWELVSTARDLVDRVNQIEDPEAAHAWLVSELELCADIGTKAEQLHYVQREQERLARSLRLEERRLARRRRQVERGASRVRALALTLLEAHMELTGKDRIDTGRVTLSLRRSQRVEVEEDRIPMEFLRPRYTVEKAALRRVLSRGESIPGARLVVRHSPSWR